VHALSLRARHGLPKVRELVKAVSKELAKVQ
jgi:hypothetical protein